MLLPLVSLGACLASCTFLIPQVVRLLRTRDAAGVSPTMAALGSMSCIAWAVYGVAVGAWPLMVTGGLAGAEYLGLCLLLHRSHRPLGRALAATSAGAGGLVAAMVVAGAVGAGMWSGLGAALNVAVIAQYLPAVLEARRGPSTSGIAAGMWAIVGLNGALWGLYGYLIGDAALIGYGLVLGAATVGVATAVLRTRRPVREVRSSRRLRPIETPARRRVAAGGRLRRRSEAA